MKRLSEEELQAIAEAFDNDPIPEEQAADFAAYQSLNRILQNSSSPSLTSEFQVKVMSQIHQQRKVKLELFEQAILMVSLFLGGCIIFWGLSLVDWGGVIFSNLSHYENLVGLSGGFLFALFVAWFGWENFEIVAERPQKKKAGSSASQSPSRPFL